MFALQRKFKIATKLYTVLALGVLFVALLAAVALNRLGETQHHLKDMHDANVASLHELSQIQLLAQELRLEDVADVR